MDAWYALRGWNQSYFLGVWSVFKNTGETQFIHANQFIYIISGWNESWVLRIELFTSTWASNHSYEYGACSIRGKMEIGLCIWIWGQNNFQGDWIWGLHPFIWVRGMNDLHQYGECMMYIFMGVILMHWLFRMGIMFTCMGDGTILLCKGGNGTIYITTGTGPYIFMDLASDHLVVVFGESFNHMIIGIQLFISILGFAVFLCMRE